MLKLLTKLKTNDSGATAIEYGLIAGLVAVGLITVLGLLGDNLTTLFDTTATSLGNVDDGS